MKLSDIRPFVRYARYITLSNGESYPTSVAGDARLFFTLDGEGEIIAGGEKYNMEKGTLLILNSGIKYTIKTPEARVSYVALNFDYTDKNTDRKHPVMPHAEGDFLPDDIIEHIKFDDVPELSSILYLTGMHAISSRLEALTHEYIMNIIFHEIKITALFSEVLCDIVRAARSESALGGGGRLDLIIGYIHDHYREPLTNEILGEHFGFHKNYISVMIKEYTGMPLHKYLNHVRVSHAIDMLSDTDASIADIAQECGFCDIYYFSRYFKRSVGISPTDYRKNR